MVDALYEIVGVAIFLVGLAGTIMCLAMLFKQMQE